MNIRSARKIAEFVKCCSFDSQGRLQTAIVPGHAAKLYQVSFSRTDKIIIEQCENVDEGELCKGHLHSICFHALAALIHAANLKGLRLVFCATQDKAELIKRTGGTLIQVLSQRSDKNVWVVYRQN